LICLCNYFWAERLCCAILYSLIFELGHELRHPLDTGICLSYSRVSVKHISDYQVTLDIRGLCVHNLGGGGRIERTYMMLTLLTAFQKLTKNFDMVNSFREEGKKKREEREKEEQEAHLSLSADSYIMGF
jgi:hypothetical protein